MKRATRAWVRKAEGDWRVAQREAAAADPVRDAVCFHCQQCAEKYLKAFLQELGLSIARIHDLERLLADLLPHDATLKSLRPRLVISHAMRSISAIPASQLQPGQCARRSNMLALFDSKCAPSLAYN